MQDPATTSTKPYLIRAIHEWCSDNGFTPYLAVSVDATVHVPMEYVSGGEIVLNASYDATSALQLGNEHIRFKARFGGKPRDIAVPVDRVLAIYARENGQGMAFPPPEDLLPLSENDGLGEPASANYDVPAKASTDAGPAERRIFQLVPALTHVEEKAGQEDHSPQPPTAGGGRPALKRIK